MTQHEKIMDFLHRRTNDGRHFVLTPMKAFLKLNITKLYKPEEEDGGIHQNSSKVA